MIAFTGAGGGVGEAAAILFDSNDHQVGMKKVRVHAQGIVEVTHLETGGKSIKCPG